MAANICHPEEGALMPQWLGAWWTEADEATALMLLLFASFEGGKLLS